MSINTKYSTKVYSGDLAGSADPKVFVQVFQPDSENVIAEVNAAKHSVYPKRPGEYSAPREQVVRNLPTSNTEVHNETTTSKTAETAEKSLAEVAAASSHMEPQKVESQKDKLQVSTGESAIELVDKEPKQITDKAVVEVTKDVMSEVSAGSIELDKEPEQITDKTVVEVTKDVMSEVSAETKEKMSLCTRIRIAIKSAFKAIGNCFKAVGNYICCRGTRASEMGKPDEPKKPVLRYKMKSSGSGARDDLLTTPVKTSAPLQRQRRFSLGSH